MAKVKISEIELKLALVKALVQKNKGTSYSIGNEVRYGVRKKRADLIFQNSFTHAFEIKSDFDTIGRLEDQVSEYLSTFDFVNVVTTRSMYKRMSAWLNKRVGVWIYYDGEIQYKRRALENKRISKTHLAYSITKESLLKKIPSLTSQASVQEVQIHAAAHLSLTELRDVFMRELESRFYSHTQSFLSEIDADIREEDLFLLRRVSRIAA